MRYLSTVEVSENLHDDSQDPYDENLLVTHVVVPEFLLHRTFRIASLQYISQRFLTVLGWCSTVQGSENLHDDS